jgi:hypothetical protein
MTYRQLISDIRQYFSGGRINSNFRLTTRRVLSEIQNTRARLIYEDMKKNRPVSDFDKQYICIRLEESDGNVCGIGPNDKCTIQKSSCPIPRIIDNRIYDISTIDAGGSLNFDYLKANEVKYKLRSRSDHEKNAAYVFIVSEGSDNYLYLVNQPFLQGIKLQAIFEDPLDAIRFATCEDPKPVCSPLDEEILLNERLIPILKELVVKYLSTQMGIQQDLYNDNTEDISGMAQKIPKS